MNTAANLLQHNPVFLDTETTGLGRYDEIVEVAVVDLDGNVLVNTLVKPGRHIPPVVTAIHGITDRDVAGAPSFDCVWRELLRPILTIRPVCIYNAAFDLRMIEQSLARFKMLPEGLIPGPCLMQMYAKFQGTPSPRRGGCKWHRLEKAARQCGLQLPAALHRSLADAELARRLLLYMAGRFL